MDVQVSFTIDQPANAVWDHLQNVEEVIGCVPGLELIEKTPDDTYKAKMSVRLGPISASFLGEGSILSADPETRIATIEGKGVDKRGGSRASAAATYEVTDGDGETTVAVKADVKLTGALAQMGRTGIVQDIANQITQEFAGCLRSKLAAQGGNQESGAITEQAASAPAPAKSVGGVKLLAGAVWRTMIARLTGLFRKRA